MKFSQNILARIGASVFLALILMLACTDVVEAQRRSSGSSFGGSRSGGSRSGSSFGGSRSGGSSGGLFRSAPSGSPGSSFGGSRGGSSFGKPQPQTQQPSSSFGGNRQQQQQPSTSYGVPRSGNNSSGSFGGTRLNSGDGYRKSYGIPRKSEPVYVPQTGTNYVVHSYGGMSDGFMMGYLMGRSSWMWSTPFHPAFYYGRPTYVVNPDGSTEVYPPTFSFVKLAVTIIIIGGVIFIFYAVLRRKKRVQDTWEDSSFS